MGYAYQATVTIPAPSSGLTNFTAVIKGSDATLKSFANGGQIQHSVTRVGQTVPADLILSSDAGGTTLYNWGVESWDATNGVIWIWALLPSYSASTMIYVSYGNAAVSTYQGGAQGAEFDANTKALYHLPDGSTLSVKDFSSNAKDGTNGASTASLGVIDGGLAVTGGGLALGIALPGSIVGSNVLTISGWAKVTAINVYQGLFSIYTSDADSMEVFIDTANSRIFGGNFFNSAFSADGSISANTWFRFDLTSNGTTTTLYINGAISGTTGTTNFSTFTQTGAIAERSTGTFVMTGQMDEVAIASAVRSAVWIATEYANQSSPPALSGFAPLASSSAAPSVSLIGAGIV